MGMQGLKPQPRPMMASGGGKPQSAPMPDAGMAGGNMDQLRALQGGLGGMAGGNMPMPGMRMQGSLGGMAGGNMPMPGMRMPDAGIMPVPGMEMPTRPAPDAGIGMPPGAIGGFDGGMGGPMPGSASDQGGGMRDAMVKPPMAAQPMPGQGQASDPGRQQFDAIQNLSRMAPQVMRAQGGKRLQRPPMPRQRAGDGGLPPAQWFQTNNGVQR